jgi:hypothetical protein
MSFADIFPPKLEICTEFTHQRYPGQYAKEAKEMGDATIVSFTFTFMFMCELD